MDLLFCKACGQSVLDEDADDCPFCGSPLKGGKPGARPAAKPAAKAPSAAPTAAKPTAAPPPAAKSSGAKPSAAETAAVAAQSASGPSADPDDPFAVDTSAHSKALAISKKQTKSHSVAVTCPMCDAPGFIPESAAGQLVRCVNAECKFPLFNAPSNRKLEPVNTRPVKPPPRKSGSGVSTAAIAMTAAGVLLVAGIGGFLAFGDGLLNPRTNKVDDLPEIDPSKLVIPDFSKTAQTPTVEPASKDAVAEVPPEVKQAAAIADLKKKIAASMVEAARNIAQSRKPWCRGQAALVFARLNQIEAMEEQLQQVARLSSETAYEAIPTRLALAWKKLAEKETVAAGAELDAIMGLHSQLPNRGITPFSHVVNFAAALVVAGRNSEAVSVIDAHRTASALEQAAAELALAQLRGDFQFSTALPGKLTDTWTSPLHAAVVVALLSRGENDAALAFANSMTNPAAAAEAQSIWAEIVVQSSLSAKLPDAVKTGREMARKLPEGKRGELLARLARLAHAAGDPSAAAMAAEAQALADTGTIPPELVLKGFASVLELRKPSAEPLRGRIRLFAELAITHAAMGSPEPANKAVESMYSTLRGLSPGVSSVRQRLKELDSQPVDQMRSRLKKELTLRNDDEVRRAFNTYRQQLSVLADESIARFELQESLTRQLISAGLFDPVWSEIKQRGSIRETDRREPYFETYLPQRLAAAAAAAGRTDLSETVQQIIGIQKQTPVGPDAEFAAAELALARGEVALAASIVNSGLNDSGRMNLVALRLTAQLANAGQWPESLLFSASMTADMPLREESMRLAAAIAARKGRAIEFWRMATSNRLEPRDAAILGGGVIQGLTASGSTPAAATKASR
jgi:hypothetical protein